MAELEEYPDVLPLPLQSGYGFQPTSPLQRTEMSSGRARQRRMYSTVPTVASVTWLFTPEEGRIFEGWYRNLVTDGADWFVIRLKTPLGIQPYKARFTDIYDGPTLKGGNYWEFSAELELIERPTLNARETADALTGGSFTDAVTLLDDVAHQWYTRSWEDA
ncbi:hypothetical protein [Kushneria phosphatilytica]|uniref:Uncharacterized protein n=1 Tax=Kushneria phosphatilytica TaxID=657387 RepID=A0A1S1NXP2_9GAMM|nr:hypothetical protein [Kushneria phosphatilytica]OHV13016.1 hypothetical protein BH688_03160 [Kushneria phosphatilytica]QEL10887.1 hypothetical protein FY550_06925 [Kushneria phosphatilytica]